MQLAGANATKWQAHKIDSTLWACGLRAQTIIGDDGPHMFNDTPGAAILPKTDEAAAPQQVVCGGLRFSQAVPGQLHFLAAATPASWPEAALCPEGTLYSWGSPRDASGTINCASLGWRPPSLGRLAADASISGSQVGLPSICASWAAKQWYSSRRHRSAGDWRRAAVRVGQPGRTLLVRAQLQDT